MNASDIITVDAGGRLFKTSTTTLSNSGAHFFRAMLGNTGAALGGTVASSITPPSVKRARTEPPAPEQKTFFVDCDPTIFEDVLYFMRRKALPFEDADISRLERLKREAEYFVYDELAEACAKRLESLKVIAEHVLKLPEAHSGWCNVDKSTAFEFTIKDGCVLLLCSAVLAGECQVKRHGGYPEEGSDDLIPGCYLKTFGKNDTGDFQLCYTTLAADDGDDDDDTDEATDCCIAHVALDQVDIISGIPTNIDFRCELGTCLSPDPGEGDMVRLFAKGGGTWSVHYWIGESTGIPQFSSQPQHSSARQVKNVRNAIVANDAANEHRTAEDKRKNLLMTVAAIHTLFDSV